jgi:hypothetical protein
MTANGIAANGRTIQHTPHKTPTIYAAVDRQKINRFATEHIFAFILMAQKKSIRNPI